MPRSAVTTVLDKAYRQSRRWHHSAFTLLLPEKTYLLKKSLVIAGLKVSKLAVERNRAKRRMRELLRANPPLRPVIAIMKPDARRMSLAEMRQGYIGIIGKVK